MELNIFPAEVETQTARYEKARFIARDLGDGTAFVRIVGRDGTEYAAAIDVVVAPVRAREWSISFQGEVWTVRATRGCGCGGTKVTYL